MSEKRETPQFPKPVHRTVVDDAGRIVTEVVGDEEDYRKQLRAWADAELAKLPMNEQQEIMREREERAKREKRK